MSFLFGKFGLGISLPAFSIRAIASIGRALLLLPIWLVVSTKPASAAQLIKVNLQWLTDAANNVQGIAALVGWTMVIVGVVIAALYFARHREDWWGALERLFAVVVAGGVVMHAADVAGLVAAGAMLSVVR